jgi:FkbM family methyltransferase
MRNDFKSRIYSLLENKEIKNILHIGAYDGASEIDFYNSLNVNSIVWIEGNPRIIENLKNNTNNYQNINHYIYNNVVSDISDNVDFHLIGSPDWNSPDGVNLGCSSILNLKKHAELYPGIDKLESIKVQTTTVDEIYKKDNLPAPDLINIDVQGAELMVFKGSETLLDNVKSIFVETADIELYENCVLKKDLNDYLNKFGFEEVLYCPHDWCWGDTLYLKKSS